jgi:hypothetical protein
MRYPKYQSQFGWMGGGGVRGTIGMNIRLRAGPPGTGVRLAVGPRTFVLSPALRQSPCPPQCPVKCVWEYLPSLQQAGHEANTHLHVVPR